MYRNSPFTASNVIMLQKIMLEQDIDVTSVDDLIAVCITLTENVDFASKLRINLELPDTYNVHMYENVFAGRFD